MKPEQIRCVMDAAEYLYTEDRMALPGIFTLLTGSQKEQVQAVYDSPYWHQVFIERGVTK